MKSKNNTSQSIADMLKSSDGYLSGEVIAKTLGISRAAVGKAISVLRDNGFEIEAATNRGYRLVSEKYMSAPAIQRYLKHDLISPNVFRSVTSTNILVKEAAENGAPEGYTVISDMQSAGRGRGGKSFFSPDGTGLYMSILLRPQMSASESLYITACAAVSTAEAIEDVLGREVSVKWVNDLFSGGLKICGILTEASFDMESGGLSYAVLGIGINVFEPKNGFGDLSGIAGAILPYSENSADIKCRLAAAIIDKFFDYYEHLSDKSYFSEYKKRLFILNHDITVIKGDLRISARALDIDEDFRLLVRYENGDEEYISSGEVSIIPTK